MKTKRIAAEKLTEKRLHTSAPALQRLVVAVKLREDKRLKKTEDQLQHLVFTLQDILYEVDAKTREFIFLSPIFELTLGYTIEDVRAMGGREKFLRQVVQKKSSDPRHRSFEEIEQSDAITVISSESWWRCRDGTIVCLEDRSMPVYEGGRLTGTYGILRNITPQKLAQEALIKARTFAEEQSRALESQAAELIRAREAAMEASRHSSGFLASMSHEIRTPMSGVIGFTGLLLESRLDQNQRRYVNLLKQSGELLIGVINDILDFSKIESGQLQLEEADFDLRNLFEEIVDIHAVAAHKKKIAMSFYMPDQFPSALRGDSLRVRQIVGNILSNAVKFTEAGEIRVRASCESREGGGELIRVEVSDSGIGISPDQMQKIFQAFTQADGSTARKHGGTGLGLTISKRLAQQMGGDIAAASQPGVGTTFTITFLLRKQSAGLRNDRRLAPLPSRVLVVDPHPTARTLMHMQLETWQVRHEVADSAAEAISMVREAVLEADPFRVLIVDGAVMAEDGAMPAELFRLKETGGVEWTMYLFPLGSVSEPEAVAPGFDIYLSKPIRQREFHDALAKLAELESRADAPGGEEHPAASRAPVARG